jgi:hypothetical protein
MNRKPATSDNLWIGYEFDGVVVLSAPAENTTHYVKAAPMKTSVTAEELYECHFASCKRAYETLPLTHRFWHELDSRERSTWEAVAMLVNSKPNLVQLRLESKVAESAAKWWKVEDWLKTHDIEKFEENDDYSSALSNFIVQLIKG